MALLIVSSDENVSITARTAGVFYATKFLLTEFVDACKQVVRANEGVRSTYGTGATFNLSPLLIGVGDTIGVHPADEYIFTIFAMQW